MRMLADLPLVALAATVILIVRGLHILTKPSIGYYVFEGDTTILRALVQSFEPSKLDGVLTVRVRAAIGRVRVMAGPYLEAVKEEDGCTLVTFNGFPPDGAFSIRVDLREAPGSNTDEKPSVIASRVDAENLLSIVSSPEADRLALIPRAFRPFRPWTTATAVGWFLKRWSGGGILALVVWWNVLWVFREWDLVSVSQRLTMGMLIGAASVFLGYIGLPVGGKTMTCGFRNDQMGEFAEGKASAQAPPATLGGVLGG